MDRMNNPYLSFVFLTTILLLSSCDKNDEIRTTQPPSVQDTIGPVITLSCPDSITHTLNFFFQVPAATAYDAQDGDVTSTISINSNLNYNLTGNYLVEYFAMDSDSNISCDSLFVTVRNWAEPLSGQFMNCFDSCMVSPPQYYPATVTVSNVTNGSISINNFGGFGTAVDIVAMVTFNYGINSTPNQSLGAAGIYTLGNGSVTDTITGEFEIGYVWDDGVQLEGCTSFFRR